MFLGPTPQQMRALGLKHTAREIALRESVPLLPGTGLLLDAAHALVEAERCGYPVILKSTAGGGGIGMRVCRTPEEMAKTFRRRSRLGAANFGQAGVYLERYVEKARHIEVQIFGDGTGNVHRAWRTRLFRAAAQSESDRGDSGAWVDAQKCGDGFGKLRNARRAHCDIDRPEPSSFSTTRIGKNSSSSRSTRGCRSNTASPKKSPASTSSNGWCDSAAGELPPLDELRPTPPGASIQVRIYAEDPAHGFRPSTGLLTEVRLPAERAVRNMGGERNRGDAVLRSHARQNHRPRRYARGGGRALARCARADAIRRS